MSRVDQSDETNRIYEVSKVIQFTEKRIEHTLWIRLSFFNMYNKIGPKMRDSKNQAKIVTSKPAIRGAIEKTRIH